MAFLNERDRIVYLPESWQDAVTTFHETRIKMNENIHGIVDVAWHREVATSEYTLRDFPDTISGDFADFDELLSQRWCVILLRRIFGEAVKIMGYNTREAEAQKSRFKEILNGEINHREFRDFVTSLEDENHTISFSQANRLAWGALKKDVISAGVTIDENDNMFWYLQGVIGRRNKAMFGK